jgi:hypothetical protein
VLKRKSESIQSIVVDVTECPINRPKEGQKAYYSEKKRHTLKTQVIIERNTTEILDAHEAKGGEHDFKRWIRTASGVPSAIRYRLMRIRDTLG